MKILCATLFLNFLAVFQLKAQQLAKIDTVQLATLIALADSTYADEILIIHKDEVLTHWKSERCDSLHFNTASMCKSWTGLVIGIMIDKGLIKN